MALGKIKAGLDPGRVQGLAKIGFLVDDFDRLAVRLKNDRIGFEVDVTDDPAFHTKFAIVRDPNGLPVQLFAERIRFR